MTRLLIVGMTFENAIAKLNKISPNWFNKNKKSLEINSDDIETIYDIFVEFATAFLKGYLTEKEIDEIDLYYKVWYGYSIRSEE